MGSRHIRDGGRRLLSWYLGRLWKGSVGEKLVAVAVLLIAGPFVVTAVTGMPEGMVGDLRNLITMPLMLFVIVAVLANGPDGRR